MRHFEIFHEYELGAKKPITEEKAVSLCMLFNVQIPHLKKQDPILFMMDWKKKIAYKTESRK